MHADDDPPLGAYLDEWLDRRRSQLRPSTMHGYRQTVDCYLRPHLGDEPLSALDRRRLERLYARLLRSGGVNGKSLSPRTVQLTHAVLHRALKDAQLDGLLERNPAALARTPRRDPRQVEADDDLQVWTAGDATRFLDLVEDHPWRALWHLALGTGARRGELLGLRWQDVRSRRLTVDGPAGAHRRRRRRETSGHQDLQVPDHVGRGIGPRRARATPYRTGGRSPPSR